MVLLRSSINIFFPVCDTVEENIKYSHKHFSDYLNNQCKTSVFFQPTDSEEITNIISTLNMNNPLVQIVSFTKY